MILTRDENKTFSTRIMHNYMIVEKDNKFQAYQRVYYCFIPTNIQCYQIGYEREKIEHSEDDIIVHIRTKIRNKETYHNYDMSKHKKYI
jgi:hypothetical protein